MSTDTAAVAAPTEEWLRALCARQHRASFACRPADRGGLGLRFSVHPDGVVAAEWTCPPGGESYEGIVHGGLLATALDSAMVHALFARGIVARTGELTVRYRQPVRAGEAVTVTAHLREAHHPLHRLEAEIHQHGALCAKASAKFMAIEIDPTPGQATEAKNPAGREMTGSNLI